jgi:hypothetical protein
MNFCYPCTYQSDQPRDSYTKQFVDEMFAREMRYLSVFKDFHWAPEILDIENNKIFIKWYKKTCNNRIYEDNDLLTNWKEDLEKIILDQVSAGYLKCSLYPHSHYYDNDGHMRTIDFYATVEKSNPTLNYATISGLIGLSPNPERFENAKTGDIFDIESIFKSGLLTYGNWPSNLTDIYNKIYENS